MPRQEANAPTERILRILDDVATLEDYCRVVEAKLIELLPEQLHLFPARPTLESVIEERARQSITLEQTRNRRAYARRVRQLGKDHEQDVTSIKDLDI